MSAIATVVLSLMLAAGCGVRGLNFVSDDRLTITAPDDRAEVRLPVEISWRVRDFEITGRDGADRRDAGYFGIYVDRAPQPPEQTQEWLFEDDPSCAGQPACPDAEQLAQFNVYSTTEQTFTIERLPAPSSDEASRRELHEVTIVLLNGRGERIGESAFTVEFEVDRSNE